jgi:hypothetical protein
MNESKVAESRIDEAVFFNSEERECVLLVLKRFNNTRELGFGSCRVYRASLVGEKWIFEKSMSMNFDRDFFEKYSSNSFDNISELARASILTSGNIRLDGCDIDEHYWFVEMKD